MKHTHNPVCLQIKFIREGSRLVISIILLLIFTIQSQAGDLYIGVSTADITPALPVALDGQMHLRIARETETPLEANVLILESRDANRHNGSVIFVSCDLVAIPHEMLNMVKTVVQKLVPQIDVGSIVMNATHTHTAPVIRRGLYPIPAKGVTQIEEYYALFAGRVGNAIYKAWISRSPGKITWGLGHAKTGYNRRAVYANGSAQMYGRTNMPEFRSIEGPEDQSVNTLFCWDEKGKLLAMGINVACTAQEVEGRSAVNADYWHPVRVTLRERFGSGLAVIAWIGAAGDQSPHLLYGSAGENRMLKLRNIDRLDEIARRIVVTVEDVHNVVLSDRKSDIILNHRTESVLLPMRIISAAEYEQGRKEVEKLNAEMKADPSAVDRLFRRVNWEGDVLKRYEQQRNDPLPAYKCDIHVIRIGDVVICTNPFELFTEYGIAMQARSKALQTFVVQLTGPGTYLPSEKAVKGGGYSAIIQSTIVGSVGGQVLVDRTVDLINELWEN